MEYYDDFDERELNLLDEYGDDYYMDDEEIPETYMSIEDLSNRDLLDEILSYIDFSGYEEERLNALETELQLRLGKWLND